MKHPDSALPLPRNNLPDQFAVTVIMERRPATANKWIDHVWKAVGITAGGSQDLKDGAHIDNLEGDIQLRFHSGYAVRLFVDECDSYYHNLASPSPKCYVVVRQDEADDEPKPFLVSLSFDEAHAYLEGDDTVFAVDVPPELYRWTESFVLEHYCPEPLKKRKRRDWRGDEAGRSKQ